MSKISYIVTFIFLTVKHMKENWHYLKHCSFLFHKNIQMKTSDPDIFMCVALNISHTGSATSGIPSFSSIFSLALSFLSLLSLLSHFSAIFTPPFVFYILYKYRPLYLINALINASLTLCRSMCCIFYVMFSSFKHIERPWGCIESCEAKQSSLLHIRFIIINKFFAFVFAEGFLHSRCQPLCLARWHCSIATSV